VTSEILLAVSKSRRS